MLMTAIGHSVAFFSFLLFSSSSSSFCLSVLFLSVVAVVPGRDGLLFFPCCLGRAFCADKGGRGGGKERRGEERRGEER